MDVAVQRREIRIGQVPAGPLPAPRRGGIEHELEQVDAPDQLMPTYESWIVRREAMDVLMMVSMVRTSKKSVLGSSAAISRRTSGSSAAGSSVERATTW